MKIKRFHQFVHRERGAVQTAVIDFLKGNIYQVSNDILEAFDKKNYDKIPEFIEKANQEDLLIEVDEKIWVPCITFDTFRTNNEESTFNLVLEDGVDLDLVQRTLRHFQISTVYYCGDLNRLKTYFPYSRIVPMKKDFQQCLALNHVTGEFSKIKESFYVFNMLFNSCWGKKVTITRDGKIRLCLHSEIIIGTLDEGNFYEVMDKIKDYWILTKDKVEKCKSCELRYVCFDCREIPRRHSHKLCAGNPYCKYDPLYGTWAE